MKKQVVVIHGGWSFNKYDDFLHFLKNRKVDSAYFFRKKDWKSTLAAALGNNYEVLMPQMPNKQNAKYKEWKIWFERMRPFFRNNVILIGHSLGGIFLAKYLSENKFTKKIGALFLVATPHNNTYGCENFQLSGDLKNVWKQCDIIHIFQSEGDPHVSKPAFFLEK